MKSKIFMLIIGFLLLFTVTAMATTYTETGDAGQTMSTAQQILGSGSLDTIYGSLAGDAWDSPDADMYLIRLAGGAFTADTLGSTVFDPMLHLYDTSGTRVLFNDDHYSLQAYITSSSLPADDYYLAISWFATGYNFTQASDWTPASYAGETPYQINLQGASFVSVPEPTTFILFGAGLAGVGFLRRRMRK
jgi:hypothetical protein